MKRNNIGDGARGARASLRLSTFETINGNMYCDTPAFLTSLRNAVSPSKIRTIYPGEKKNTSIQWSELCVRVRVRVCACVVQNVTGALMLTDLQKMRGGQVFAVRERL